MQIHTTARHFEMTEGLRQHIEDRLSRFERVLDRPVDARVILSVEKYRHQAEVTVHVMGGEIVGKGESRNMYVSVDLAVDKAMRQLRRLKERAQARPRKRGARNERMARIDVFRPAAKGRPRTAAPASPAETEHQPVERLTLAEALTRVRDGGPDCLVFFDEAGGGLRVLYRRRDGRLGLVEPEAAR